MVSEPRSISVIDNTIIINTISYYIKMACDNIDENNCNMTVVGGDMGHRNYKYNTLEDAFRFYQGEINNHVTLNEIDARYNEFYKEKDRYGVVLMKTKEKAN